MVPLAAACMTATTASLTTAAMAAAAEMRRGHAGCVEVRSRELGVREILLRHHRREAAVGEIQPGVGRIAARAGPKIRRVGDNAGIEPPDVGRIVRIARPIRLAWAEREPADQRAGGGRG